MHPLKSLPLLQLFRKTIAVQNVTIKSSQSCINSQKFDNISMLNSAEDLEKQSTIPIKTRFIAKVFKNLRHSIRKINFLKSFLPISWFHCLFFVAWELSRTKFNILKTISPPSWSCRNLMTRSFIKSWRFFLWKNFSEIFLLMPNKFRNQRVKREIFEMKNPFELSSFCSFAFSFCCWKWNNKFSVNCYLTNGIRDTFYALSYSVTHF